MAKRKADFALASETPGAGGGINPLSAPQMNSAGGIQAPRIHAAHQNAATVEAPKAKSSALSPDAFERGMGVIAESAMKYRDNQDTLYATDAYLKAREEAQKALYYSPTDGDKTAPGFLNLKGKDAVDVSAAAQRRVEDIYTEYANSLSPNARKKYLAMSNGTKISALDKVAKHTVAQQKEFQQQTVYALTTASLQEAQKDPMGVFENGVVQQTMAATFESPKSQMAVLGKIESVSIDTLLLESPAAAEAWIKKYGMIEGDPEVRVKSLKKIATAKKALLGGVKDNAAKVQKQLKAQAFRAMPTQVVGAIKEMDGAKFSQAFADLDSVYADDPAGAQKVAKAVIDNAMDISLLGDGNNRAQSVAQVKAQWTSILKDAADNGTELPLFAVAHIQSKLDDLRKVDAQRTSEAENANAEAFLKQVVWDEDGKASLPDGVSLADFNPNAMSSAGSKVYNQISKVRQKETKAAAALRKAEANQSFMEHTQLDENGSVSFTGDLSEYNYAELSPANRKVLETVANGLNSSSDREVIDRQKATSAKFRAGIKVDEATGKRVYSGDLKDVDWVNLPSSDKKVFNALLKDKEQEVKYTGKQLQYHNGNIAMQWFYDGKLGKNGSKRAAFFAAQADPDTAMTQAQYTKIKGLIYKADTGKDPKMAALKSNVGYNAAVKWIDTIARQGLFSTDMKAVSGEKLYKEEALDFETVQAKVAAKSAITNYMIQHPDADPMEVLKDHLSKWKWESGDDKPGLFTGNYDKYTPTTQTANATAESAKEKAPVQKAAPVVKQAPERPAGVPAHFKHYKNANADWWGDKASGEYWDGKSVRGGK